MNAKIIPLARPDARPRVSVIMVSYMTGPALTEAVLSVLDDQDVFELILVDNGNTAPARRALMDIIVNRERVRLMQGHGNVGFARGCNYGAALAAGDYFLFMNPDAVLAPGAVGRLTDNTKGLNRPWIAGGMLRDRNGREQRGGRRRELTPLRAFATFTGLHKLGLSKPIHMENDPLPGGVSRVDIVSGAFMMVDRASFEMLGGFDERYFLHVEDIDICRRARQAGGDVIYDPSSAVLHYGSTSQIPRRRVEWEKFKGFCWYFWNYSPGFLGKALTVLASPLMAAAIMGRAYFLAFKGAFKGL